MPVAHQEIPDPQIALDDLERAQEARIAPGEDAKFGQQQEAGIDYLAVQRRRERPGVGPPGLLEHALLHVIGARAPVVAALGKLQPRGDARQAVAGGPAHGRRERVAPLRAAELPDARIGLIEQRHRLLAQGLQALELCDVAGSLEALIEKGLGGSEDHRSVDIVLALAVGEIADAHRTHALDACERLDHARFNLLCCD